MRVATAALNRKEAPLLSSSGWTTRPTADMLPLSSSVRSVDVPFFAVSVCAFVVFVMVGGWLDIESSEIAAEE